VLLSVLVGVAIPSALVVLLLALWSEDLRAQDFAVIGGRQSSVVD
jgi:hypothetical protein